MQGGSLITFKDWLVHRIEVLREVAQEFDEREDPVEAAFHKGVAFGLSQALQEYARREPKKR